MKRNNRFLRASVLVLIAGAIILTGCQSVKYGPADEARYIKPTVAVMSFKNKAPVTTKWQLGDALADQLIDRLIATHRYVVLERSQLNAVFKELKRADDPRFRQTGGPELGRLKHVQYLVKGIITDFGHVETVEGFWRLFDWGLLGSSTFSVVRATIYVVDVQSGQIIASQTVEAKVRDRKDEQKVELNGMAFGSYTFYQTSLGQATDKMLDKAVRAIARSIAERPFQPKIAAIVDNQIVINAGSNRNIKPGAAYIVRPRSQAVIDPDTGDLLGYIAGHVVGRIRITQVTEKHAIAEVITGTGFQVGQTLFPSDTQTAQKPAAPSSY